MRSMIWVLLVWGSSAFAEMCADLPKQLSFKGEFGAVSATQPECERLFAVTQYETDHFRVGPTDFLSVPNHRQGHGREQELRVHEPFRVD